MNRWGRGYIPDRGDVRRNLRPFSRVGGGQLPDAPVHLTVPIPPMDQGITNTCVPHARAAAIVTRYFTLTGKHREPASVALWYALARLDDLSSPDAPLVDLGCRPTTAVRVARDWGVVPQSFYPLDPGAINDRPNFEALEAAAEHPLDGHYAIDATGRDRNLEIRRALTLGFPVPVALAINGPQFEGARAGDIIRPPDGALDGLHEILVVGWIPGLNGRGSRFEILNSWGGDWCDHGYAEIDEAYLADDALCIDADVVTLVGDEGSLSDAA